MIETVDNGRVMSWKPLTNTTDKLSINHDHKTDLDVELLQFEEEINPNNLKYKCSALEQFKILFRRASKQIYRNKVSQFFKS